jgi:hypothetical protein
MGYRHHYYCPDCVKFKACKQDTGRWHRKCPKFTPDVESFRPQSDDFAMFLIERKKRKK